MRNYRFGRWPARALVVVAAMVAALAGMTPTAAAEGEFQTAGSLRFGAFPGRYAHTATLLPDGRVLVAGGKDGIVVFAGEELWSPTTREFSSVDSNPEAGGSLAAATLLQDGRVLVTGGVFDVDAQFILFLASLYDPSTDTWSRTGDMKKLRALHTATLLPDGTVLNAGGSDGLRSASAEIYDPEAGTFSFTESMQTARSRHQATLLADGRVLVTGGGPTAETGALAEIYDPATGTWEPTGSMKSPRFNHRATLLIDGRVLITAGGDYSDTVASAELYDPTTGRFGRTGSMAAARVAHTATLLPNGKVLVTGGGEGGFALSSAELYDADAGKFELTGSMTTARTGHTATLLGDGNVVVIGGVTLGALSVLEPVAAAGLYEPAPLVAPKMPELASFFPNEEGTAAAIGWTRPATATSFELCSSSPDSTALLASTCGRPELERLTRGLVVSREVESSVVDIDWPAVFAGAATEGETQLFTSG